MNKELKRLLAAQNGRLRRRTPKKICHKVQIMQKIQILAKCDYAKKCKLCKLHPPRRKSKSSPSDTAILADRRGNEPLKVPLLDQIV